MFAPTDFLKDAYFTVLPLIAFQGAVNIFSAFYINNEHRFDFLFKKIGQRCPSELGSG